MKKLLMKDPTEDQTQITFVAWCRAQAGTMPELAEVYHVPNYRHIPGTDRQRIAAVERLRKLGFPDGYPDLAWDFSRGKYHGLRIEFKAPNGKVTEHQATRITLLMNRNYYAAVCVGFEAAAWLARAYWQGALLPSGRFPRTKQTQGRRRPPHELFQVGLFDGSRICRCVVCAVYGTASALELFRCTDV